MKNKNLKVLSAPLIKSKNKEYINWFPYQVDTNMIYYASNFNGSHMPNEIDFKNAIIGFDNEKKKNFKVNCFFNKNTLEIRRKLEILGYYNPYSTNDTMYNNIVTCSNGLYYSIFNREIGDDEIDCSNNEDLFFDLISINDNDDRFQWFVDDNNHWIKSDSIHFDYKNYHKATVEEIINRYN